MDTEQILEIDQANKQRFPSQRDYYKFLMFQLQCHLIEADDLKEANDAECVKKIVDIAILAKLLALSEGADESIFSERYLKFKENMNSKR